MGLFENYILNKVISTEASLTNVPITKFLNFPEGFSDVSESTTPSASGVTEAVSETVELGFNFSFDETSYTKIIACAAGWCALVDPSENSIQDVRNSLLISGSYSNEGINLTNTTKNILVCPWFDRLKNRFDLSTVNQTEVLHVDSSANIDRERLGFKAPSLVLSNTNFGVKYYRDKTKFGRRFIIRWNSISAITSPIAQLTFECIFYENGKIEFRYAPGRIINQITGTASESATIGIFASGSNRFRDFSPTLGYLDQYRTHYKYGGAPFASNFSDSGTMFFTTSSFKSRNYVWRLRPDNNWPGLNKTHAMFSFEPPVARKKILPRLELKKNDSCVTKMTVGFDDQKVIIPGQTSIINYPSTLPRFFDKTSISRQNIFSSEGNELETTGSTTFTASEQFFYNIENFETESPFNDVNYFNNDLFFSSSIVTGFNEIVASKKQIELNFPINKKTRLLDTTASIYYLNVKNNSWEIPVNSISLTDSDIANASSYVGQKVPEDMRGFNSFGMPVSSGSNESSNGTFQDMDASLTTTGEVKLKRALYEDDNVFSKSVFKNPNYKAINDETFSITIDEPFLLEKLIFEIPIECGETWFNDKTSALNPFEVSGSASDLLQVETDYGGPGITVALYNQIQSNYGTRREIIASGTITHQNDITNVLLVSTPFNSSSHQIKAEGFEFFGTPAAVLYKNNGNTFTGSLVVKSEPESTISTLVSVVLNMIDTTPSVNRAVARTLISAETLDNVNEADVANAPTFRIYGIKPTGRAGDRQSSGRSVFGGDITSLKNGIVSAWTGIAARNPFYLTGSAHTEMTSRINSTDKFVVSTVVPISTTKKSPYLLQKNDKLVLSISKHRPCAFLYENDAITYSGSVGHDVSLITGSVKLTMFGTSLRENLEIIPKPTKIFTNVVSEVIGADDVVDQYEVSSQGELVGSYTDDFITGSARINRGRVFSRFNARSKEKPGLTEELDVNPFLSFRITPWFESTGVQNFCQHVDVNERFWDSLMPGITDCFKANGASITTDFLNFSGFDSNVGRIYLDTTLGSSAVSDKRWMKSYPFEPRYLGINRSSVLSKTLFSTLVLSGSTTISIEPIQLTGFYPFIAKKSISGADSALNLQTYIDVDLNAPEISCSMNIEDISRFMFGYGDLNTINSLGQGSNKAPDVRQNKFSIQFSVFEVAYGVSPIVRGWKYGVKSGLPDFNKAYFRRNSFGQFRDMLEQRLQTKFFVSFDKAVPQKKLSITSAGVSVKFINSLGDNTQPINTFSQNLSNECTSSFPYFDGETRNRPDINLEQQNSSVVFID